jgi:hypothetical protein
MMAVIMSNRTRLLIGVGGWQISPDEEATPTESGRYAQTCLDTNGSSGTTCCRRMDFNCPVTRTVEVGSEGFRTTWYFVNVTRGDIDVERRTDENQGKHPTTPISTLRRTIVRPELQPPGSQHRVP